MQEQPLEHSYRVQVEKISCTVSLGLYGIGVMRKPPIDVEFEHKFKNCSYLSDVHKLVYKSPEKNLKMIDV